MLCDNLEYLILQREKTFQPSVFTVERRVELMTIWPPLVSHCEGVQCSQRWVIII